MGKIFSWGEIESNQIPQTKDFFFVAEKIKSQFEKCQGIIGGIICGSAVWNQWTLRSDIDCVLVYDQICREKVLRTIQEVQTFANRLHVPVEFMPQNLSLAQTPFNYLGPSFGKHLKWVIEAGGLIKENPLNLISLEGSLKEDIRDYIRNRLRKIEKGESRIEIMDEKEFCIFLSKILELPVHLARKILVYKNISLFQGDTKTEVIKHYLPIIESDERDIFEEIIETDREYTNELFRQMESPNENSYRQLLGRIRRLIPLALQFVKINSDKLM